MKPIALLLNDIHCGVDHLEDFEKNCEEAINVCKINGIGHMIIGGDVYQSRASQPLSVFKVVQNFLYDAVASGIQVTIIPGNHDLIDQEDVYSYNHIFRDIPNVFVVDDYDFLELGGVLMHMLAYFPENGTAPKRISEIQIKNGVSNILYCHQGIRGGLSRSSDDELPTSFFEKFDKVFVGHYHDRKRIPNSNVYYIGASRQHTYGEDEEKGYTILYDDCSTEFVKNEISTRYYTIKCKPDDITREIANYAKVFNDNRYRVRLQLIVPNDYTVDKDALIAMGFSKIEIILPDIEATTSTQETLSAKFDKDSIADAYIEFCGEERCNPDPGLVYLSQI